MLTFMEAIGRQEGFGPPSNRATRNNNPGNINFAPWTAAKFGAVLETIPEGYDEVARFAHFPDVATGWAAMRALLTESYVGLTIAAALAKWAPPSDGNNVSAYQAGVCASTGLTPDTVLTSELLT